MSDREQSPTSVKPVRGCRLIQVLKLALAIAVGAGVDSAWADWLVTRSGELIVTDGAWRVEGRNVVFIAGSPNAAREISGMGDPLRVRTMPAGTLFALPVSEIDLEQSKQETAFRSAQNPLAEQSRVDPIARKASRTSPTPLRTPPPVEYLEAREDWKESRFSRAPIELQVSLEGSTSDNFFRASDDRPQVEVRAAAATARLAWTWSRKQPLKSYLLISQTQYQEIPSMTGYGAGLRYEGRRHSVDLSARLTRNRRALDIGGALETFEAANLFVNQGVYALRSRFWEWRLIGLFIDQEFDETSRNDGQFFGGRSSIVYRGFGRIFAPEIGAAWGERVSVTETASYSEQELYLKLRFSPARRLAFDASVRDRIRLYGTGDLESSNYGRRDTRRRWTLDSRILITRKVAWDMTYSRLEGDSTRRGRSFAEHIFTSGLSLKLSSTPWDSRPRNTDS